MPTTRSLREGGCRKKHKRLEPQRHEDHKGKEKLFFVLFVMKALATEARRHRGKAFFSSPWRFLSWQRNPFPFTFVVQGYYAFCNNKDQVLNVRS